MSLTIQENYSLHAHNTFGIAVQARWYAEAHNDTDVLRALRLAKEYQASLFVLGGGSNLLLTQNIEVLVLRMASQGRRQLPCSNEGVLVEAEAGENWHEFVQWTLAQGWHGLENLSLIPGTVGAAPVQNIGAYGIELKDVLHSLTALNRETGELHEFLCADCQFAYRDSRFKREPNHWLILRARFWLNKSPLHLEYGPLRQRLMAMGIEQPTALQVSQAVCAIRAEKLPDPNVLGNAGSFFKNPVISAEQAETLRQQWPDLVSYPVGNTQIKLAAGWLIERAGWKGFREGHVGVHSQQALVLVNHGGATGAEVLALAQRIQADIEARFGVTLEIEPNVY